MHVVEHEQHALLDRLQPTQQSVELFRTCSGRVRTRSAREGPPSAASAWSRTPNGSDVSIASPWPRPTRRPGSANRLADSRMLVLPSPASPSTNNTAAATGAR